MNKDIWEERRRGLEEEFFAKQNRQQIEKLRMQQVREQAIKDLEMTTGIKDTSVLERLYDAGVTPATALALSLVPLITVAWADHKMDQEEREAILKAAKDLGIEANSDARELLNSWLEQKPGSSLTDAWALSVKALGESMDAGSYAKLKTGVLDRARAVAAAAGGILGLGPKISRAEEEALARLEQAFNA